MVRPPRLAQCVPMAQSCSVMLLASLRRLLTAFCLPSASIARQQASSRPTPAEPQKMESATLLRWAKIATSVEAHQTSHATKRRHKVTKGISVLPHPLVKVGGDLFLTFFNKNNLPILETILQSFTFAPCFSLTIQRYE